MAVRRGRGQHEAIAPVIPLRPATTPEARENQLIADAVDLAQRQLRDGTASAQVITHFLKLGSTREQLEQERLRNENLLLQKKGEAMESAKRIEELYGQALSAMRTYQGQPDLALEGLADEDL
jgi:hypothetical protein